MKGLHTVSRILSVVLAVCLIVTPEFATELYAQQQNETAAFQPAGEQQTEEQAAKKQQKEEQPAGEQQTEEQPAGEQQTEEQPAGERQTVEQAAEEQQTEEQPAGEQQTEEQPAGEQQTVEQAAEEQQTEEQPAGEQQKVEQPAEEQQKEEQPAGEQQTVKQPAGEQQAEEQADGEDASTVSKAKASPAQATALNALYASTLPVIYINTNDGAAVTSKTVYKGGTMSLQGNAVYNENNGDLYNGAISIRGRGNTTWSYGWSRKPPYKIKLDKKANLFGLGKSKHWVLLANYLDESIMRNKTSYDLAARMGLTALPCVQVDIVFNGRYAGNYLLVGHIRIEDDRVDIFDWEGCAEDTAKAIGKANGITGDALDRLKDQMNNNLAWITTGTVTFNNVTYKIADYADLPKNADGQVDTNGGFLFELDENYDEVSKFKTSTGLPMMFKSPEYANTNATMFNEAKTFIQATEDAARSEDYYVTYKGKRVHYSEIIDVPSLVRYYLVQEFYFNNDGLRKSCYMYKDIGGKLTFGPVWDMDYTSQSTISNNGNNWYNNWQLNAVNTNQNWVKSLVRDPYFVSQVYEAYWQYRDEMVNIVKAGGVIDQQKSYMAQSGVNNYNGGFTYFKIDFNTAVAQLRSFLTNRITWLDAHMKSASGLLTEYGKYTGNDKVSVAADTKAYGKTTYTATVDNSSSKGVQFFLNGILVGSADLVNAKASITVKDDLLTDKENGLNTIQVRCYDTTGALRDSGNYTGYAYFKKSLAKEIQISLNQTDQILLTKGNTKKLDYTLTINGNVVTDEEILKDVKLHIEKTGGFEKAALSSLEVLQATDDGTAQITAAASGVVRVKVSLDDVTSENSVVVVVPGDVNMDGRVSVKDAALMASYVRSKRVPAGEYALYLMDVDANGKIGAKDVTALVKYLRETA